MRGQFRAEGDVRLGTETVRHRPPQGGTRSHVLEGRFAYTWPSADHPARIESALSAPEVDFDRAYGLVQDVFAGTAAGVPLEWPKEGTLALNIAQSSVAGVTVQRADVNLRFAPQALEIERLAIADFGGASIAAKGNIDFSTRAPRGTVTLDLDIRALDGVTALLEKVAPQAAARAAPLGRPVRARQAAGIARRRCGGPPVPRNAGRRQVQGERSAGGPSHSPYKAMREWPATPLTLTDAAKLGAAKLDVAGRLEAQDGGALIALVGLDRLVAVDKGAGAARPQGHRDRRWSDGGGSADHRGGADASASGSLRLPVGRAAAAGLALKLAEGASCGPWRAARYRRR